MCLHKELAEGTDISINTWANRKAEEELKDVDLARVNLALAIKIIKEFTNLKWVGENKNAKTAYFNALEFLEEIEDAK